MLSAGQFRRALNRKYDIKERQSNADLLRAKSTAGLQGSQANEIDTRVQQLGAPVPLGALQSSLGGGLAAQQPPGAGLGIYGAGLFGQSQEPPGGPTQPSNQSQSRLNFGMGLQSRRQEPVSRLGLNWLAD